MTRPASTPGALAAVDLGATSGRVIIGRLEGARPDSITLTTRQLSRFANHPVRTPDGLHWNLLGMYHEVLQGLAAAEHASPGSIASIGVDSWGVDYGLLRDGRLLGTPYHYRDERTAAGVRAVHARVSPEELYARSGIQHMPINTLFQLATEGPLLSLADQMLLIPDLISYWLTGVPAAERTIASTTGLLNPHAREWDLPLAERIGIPPAILPRLVDAGARLGALDAAAAAVVGRALDVVTVPSHDTASAVAAIPASRPDFAFISCGTWGLVGLELDAPVLGEAARAAGFTNEGGLDGTTRFLHNVMGLWILSESIREWAPPADAATQAALLSELLADAARIDRAMPVFDVDDPAFATPGNMPERIRAWYRARGERAPESRAELVRCIVESLAQAFADAVSQAAQLANHEVAVIHIVGGGSQNTLLCQAVADRAGLPVIAGPTEATAMGNLLVQARTHGWITPEREAIRGVVARSTSVTEYLPRSLASA